MLLLSPMVVTQHRCPLYAQAKKIVHVVFHVLPCLKAKREINLHETNFFRNFFANFLSGVCHDVEIGTHLLQLQGDTFVIKSTTTVNDAR